MTTCPQCGHHILQLTPTLQRVFEYILTHPGCGPSDITSAIYGSGYTVYAKSATLSNVNRLVTALVPTRYTLIKHNYSNGKARLVMYAIATKPTTIPESPATESTFHGNV
jgi:hypothetical protein